jgi:type II secretory pathway pseudopilin PulG
MLLVLLAIFAAVAFLAGSAWIIWRYDPSRIWDHFARSLVQTAIAVISVLVAFVLFEQQLMQQDTRMRLQQARSAVSTLRSIIVSAGSQAKDITILASNPIISSDCELKSVCDDYDDWLLEVQRSELDRLSTSPQALLFGTIDARAAVSELIKNNYIFSDGLISLTFSAIEQYDRGIQDVVVKVDKVREQHRSARTKFSDREIPPYTVAILYGGYAYEQARSAQVVVTFICRLDQINKHLLAFTEPDRLEFGGRYPPIESAISCAPYDKPFEHSVKVIEHRK